MENGKKNGGNGHNLGISGIPVEKTRYTKEERLEFKKIILEKLEKAYDDLNVLLEAGNNFTPAGTDDTSFSFNIERDNFGELAREVLAKEENLNLANRQRVFISKLEGALKRVNNENGNYGVCRVTGKLIPKERLRSVPHTTLSIEAKMEQSCNSRKMV